MKTWFGNLRVCGFSLMLKFGKNFNPRIWKKLSRANHFPIFLFFFIQVLHRWRFDFKKMGIYTCGMPPPRWLGENWPEGHFCKGAKTYGAKFSFF